MRSLLPLPHTWMSMRALSMSATRRVATSETRKPLAYAVVSAMRQIGSFTAPRKRSTSAWLSTQGRRFARLP